MEFPRAGYWEPIIAQISRQNGNFPMAWSTTDAVRSFKYAVGVSECDAAQISAIQADNRVLLFDESLLFSTFGSLPGAARNNINKFLTDAGIDPANNAEVMHDLWSRVSAVVDFKSIDQLLAKLQHDIDNP